MPFEMFKTMCDEWKEIGVKGIVITGGGEPTLHPYFNDIVRYTISQGIKVGVITNGTRLKESLLECEWVRVSLNAPDSDGHERHTRSKHWKNVINNVGQFKKGRCKVGLKFLLGEHNKFTEEAVKALCDSLGVGYYDIKYLRSCPEQIVRRESVVKPCGLTQLKTVVDWTGTYYVCPFYNHHENSSIGRGRLQSFWGGVKHREAIANIRGENCAKYDCCMLTVNTDEFKDAEVAFI
jgi:pyruvate-formate lyase-activating enzyme